MDQLRITCPSCNETFSADAALQNHLKAKEAKYQEDIKVKEKLIDAKYKLELQLKEKSLEKTLSKKIEEASKAKLDDLQAEVKNQVVHKIGKQNKILEQFRLDQERLKEGLAQDIEKFEQNNKTNFQDFSKANQENLENYLAKNQRLNQRLIEILQESLKQGIETKSILDSINKKLTQLKNDN